MTEREKPPEQIDLILGWSGIACDGYGNPLWSAAEMDVARAELQAIRLRCDRAEQRAGEMDAALSDAIRTWTFGEGQFPTHTWHDREDWFERHAVAQGVRRALSPLPGGGREEEKEL